MLTPWRSRTHRVEVVIPEVKVERVALVLRCAPELARCEAYSIDVLGLLAGTVCAGVGEHEHTPVLGDDAAFAPRVAGEPCVPGRVDVTHDHSVACSEARGNCVVNP